ncbi:MurR/RpiR family transcriptional regulator [Paenibacillus mesotrionivorans]|uniref:MurR/RpiR family transcriptional regulator n=1 Tax=Paenibacillus mesotrionivorans TaxID=3160968 RepID=A0ACC7NY66_9BACL
MKARTPNSGLARIQAVYKDLPPKVKTVADHILAQPQDVVHLSITQLAEVTRCAEATIFRLCRLIGMKGYQELKISLAGEMVEQPVQNIHEEVLPEDDMAQVARKVFTSNIIGITDTLQLLDTQSLIAAVQLLNSARNVCIYAVGGSAPIAMDAYNKFIRAGISCVMHSDPHLQLTTAALLGPESVVLAISHSGSSKDLIEVVKAAGKTGAKTIVITSYTKSSLAQLADVKLYSSTRETSFRTEAISARIAQLCIIDSLYVGLSLARQEETLGNLQKIREVISTKRL